ncbi:MULTISPECIES: transposase domain-containing protein [Myxococcus]|uniref:Transposase IS66 C-terminal domain-containing protein n=1 Tax=Myxococcus xanthus TaxID=34 RepID=A0AAE6G4Z7_MYXXA|nr:MULTISPECIES: transposase domain-containing protein [Myxococcus]QDE71027.1 hypothetical protein BHS09_30855 [Myxococcus xanthus]QDE78306.1 hypothetical protein BHS08_30875 [Myxococcus xanthus]QDE99845.1 hypothetical protein BHS05_30645 [Myxococcus xanthus]QDF07588.1 hypothetical protein BHS04_30955 [Myxococcus xanthus]WAM25202.1 hypothetical protein OZ403_32495 [Myxococcus sp. NMCA1]
MWHPRGSRAEAGLHRLGLYALVATCEANGASPEAYLADILLRVRVCERNVTASVDVSIER